jgi:hypothetical protein
MGMANLIQMYGLQTKIRRDTWVKGLAGGRGNYRGKPHTLRVALGQGEGRWPGGFW